MSAFSFFLSPIGFLVAVKGLIKPSMCVYVWQCNPPFFFFAIEPAVSFFLFLERTCSQLKRRKKKKEALREEELPCSFYAYSRMSLFRICSFFFFLRLFCEVRKVFTSETPPVCLTPVAAFAASSFPPLLLPRYVCVCVFFFFVASRSLLKEQRTYSFFSIPLFLLTS